MTSTDGFSWTKADGLRPGIPCIGTIQPPTNIKATDSEFDVIVVGAGYAGLTAARDISIVGHRLDKGWPLKQKAMKLTHE